METLGGQGLQSVIRIHPVFLDIAEGASKERVDIWRPDYPEFVANKSRIDFERHKTQLRSERMRGVEAVWMNPFMCVLGARGRDLSAAEGGFEKVFSATLIANRRQFFLKGSDPDFPATVEHAPSTGDKIEVEDEHYEVQVVNKDVAVLHIALAEDLGYDG